MPRGSHIFTRAVALIVLTCAAITNAAASIVTQLPYRVDFDGWYTADISVNGAPPVPFIIDTGATVTSVFQNLNASHNFETIEGDPVRIIGLFGVHEIPRTQIGNLGIGDLTVQHHSGALLDDWALPRETPGGVLGLDILSQYIVELDHDEKVFRLYDNENREDIDLRGYRATALSPLGATGAAGKLYMIDARMNGASLKCIIDLGASGSVINKPALEKIIEHTARRRANVQRIQSALSDVFDNRESAPPVAIDIIKVAGWRLRQQAVFVHDAQLFAELGVADEPYCLIGADLFRGRSMMFDFDAGMFYLSR